MRDAKDRFTGQIVQVLADTPVRYVDGECILLTPAEIAEKTARDAQFAKNRADKAYVENRKAEYGTPEQQLEMIAEKGVDFFQAHIASVKEKYPKP